MMPERDTAAMIATLTAQRDHARAWVQEVYDSFCQWEGGFAPDDQPFALDPAHDDGWRDKVRGRWDKDVAEYVKRR